MSSGLSLWVFDPLQIGVQWLSNYQHFQNVLGTVSTLREGKKAMCMRHAAFQNYTTCMYDATFISIFSFIMYDIIADNFTPNCLTAGSSVFCIICSGNRSFPISDQFGRNFIIAKIYKWPMYFQRALIPFIFLTHTLLSTSMCWWNEKQSCRLDHARLVLRST